MKNEKQIEIRREESSTMNTGVSLRMALRNKQVNISEETTNRLDRLWKYDLSFLTKKLISLDHAPQIKTEQLYPLEAMLGTMNKNKAGELEIEFKRFMTLILLKPDKQVNLGPSRPVDMYWHLFILHTKEYQKFSDEVFGKFMHHVPTTEETREHTRNSYKLSVNLYKELFGERNPKIWHELKVENGSCGTGSGGGGDCSECNAG